MTVSPVRKLISLRRAGPGDYRTRDGKVRVQHWDTTAGNRQSWAVADWDGTGWEFRNEFETLGDARRYLSGDTTVFVLS